MQSVSQILNAVVDEGSRLYAVDYFENISAEIKRSTFLPDSYYSPRGFKVSLIQLHFSLGSQVKRWQLESQR
jgi:hypothetical protein